MQLEIPVMTLCQEVVKMWERYNTLGQQAMSQGKPVDAEAQFKLALQEAESAGPNDPRIVTSLNNLGNCYRQQGKFAEAEPCYKRAIEVQTRLKGPLSPDMVPIFDNYAKMLRAAQREAEAQKMEAKARAIFAKR